MRGEIHLCGQQGQRLRQERLRCVQRDERGHGRVSRGARRGSAGVEASPGLRRLGPAVVRGRQRMPQGLAGLVGPERQGLGHGVQHAGPKGRPDQLSETGTGGGPERLPEAGGRPERLLEEGTGGRPDEPLGRLRQQPQGLPAVP
jgi:hypothetical protein